MKRGSLVRGPLFSEPTMWIVKGIFLGIWLFSFGTIAYLWFSIYRRLPPSTGVGVSAFAAYTTYDLFWWTALVFCLAVGLFITRSWSGKPGGWPRLSFRVAGCRIPAIFRVRILIFSSPVCVPFAQVLSHCLTKLQISRQLLPTPRLPGVSFE
jgi:hypothetical protein